MRVGFLSLALIIVAFAGAPGSTASATGSAFAQPQQPRNQTQAQEGLQPDQKKKISGYGPEDVFGVSGEDPRRQAGKQQRKQQPTPTPQSPPPQRSSTTSAATPSTQSSATPTQSSTAEPSPTVAAGGLENGLQQSSLNQGDPSDKIAPKWAAPALIVMALIVSALLVFTLTKLVEKIRESSSG
jgi:hypothetical protein